MSNVINKETLEYLTSVGTTNYMNDDWIINPVLPKCDKKYWKIVGVEVEEMTQAEKDEVDNKELELQEKAQKEAQKEILVQDKLKEIGINGLIQDGILNSDGSIK